MSHLSIVTPTTVPAFSVAGAIDHYLAHIKRRGASPNTIKAYGSDLRQFARFVEVLGHGQLMALMSARHVSRWLDQLHDAGVSPRSQARKLTVLRGLFKHGRREGWLGHDPTADERVSFRSQRVIAPEMAALLGMIDAIPAKGRLNLRDRAMLRLSLDSGLRISEVAGLDLPGADSQSTIDLGRQLVHVVGKGGDTETLPFDATTRRIIEAWLHVRFTMADPAELSLFVSSRGTRPTRQALHELIKRRAAAVDLPSMTWHKLRHRRITQVLETLGPKVAQQFARHSSIETTGHYGHHASGVVHDLVRERAPLEQGRASA